MLVSMILFGMDMKFKQLTNNLMQGFLRYVGNFLWFCFGANFSLASGWLIFATLACVFSISYSAVEFFFSIWMGGLLTELIIGCKWGLYHHEMGLIWRVVMRFRWTKIKRSALA